MDQALGAGPGADDDESGGNDENDGVEPKAPPTFAPVALLVSHAELDDVGQDDGEGRAQRGPEELDQVADVGQGDGQRGDDDHESRAEQQLVDRLRRQAFVVVVVAVVAVAVVLLIIGAVAVVVVFGGDGGALGTGTRGDGAGAGVALVDFVLSFSIGVAVVVEF